MSGITEKPDLLLKSYNLIPELETLHPIATTPKNGIGRGLANATHKSALTKSLSRGLLFTHLFHEKGMYILPFR